MVCKVYITNLSSLGSFGKHEICNPFSKIVQTGEWTSSNESTVFHIIPSVHMRIKKCQRLIVSVENYKNSAHTAYHHKHEPSLSLEHRA